MTSLYERMHTRNTGGTNMRRLWSHIIIAATSLLMVGATFATVVTNIESNIEFTPGKEFVFRVSKKGEDGNPDDSYILNKDNLVEVNKIADKMEERLKTVDISRYEVTVQGYDTIKVNFTTDDDDYSILQSYLPFNGTLAISNSKGDYATAEQFLNPDEKAYVEITDGYPQVIIPINRDNEYFKKVYDEAKKMVDENNGEVVEHHEDEEGEEEHEDTTKAYLYLWYDFVEDYYSYDKIGDPNSETYNPTVASKVLMQFDASNPFFEKDGEEQNALMTYVTPNGENTEITPETLSETYRNARYYVNLLNAGEISKDFTVNLLFTDKADVWVEDLVALGSQMTVAWSRTFIATLCAIVVVSLLLIYFYRLGALSVATTSIVSTFAGLLFIVLFSAEFNIAGIIGLLSVAVTSIISGIIYLNKLKEECYRGRSLKKANSEAAKKALLPTVDIHVVLVAVGVACYLLGGNLMKAFAVSTVLGGLVSLVLAIFGLRGLLWLATNEQGIANRYDLFDVSKEQIPNALEEEKQKYYGPNADKDFTKFKKPVGIVSAALLVASIVTMIVVGVVNKGAVYNSAPTYNNSQVYIEFHSASQNNVALSTSTKEEINKMLDNATMNGNKLSEITEIDFYDYTANYRTTSSGVETVYYGYYRINFASDLSDGSKNMIKYADKEAVTPEEFFDIEYLTSASDAGLAFDKVNVTISLKNSVRASGDQPEFKSLILATTVAVGISALYLLLRYRLSRGLAVIGLAVLSVGISAGIFSMLYFLPVSTYISIALPFIALYTFDIAILFMNKEREMVLEDRSKDNSIEARENIMKKALGISSTPITISFIIALYLGVNFFGFMYTSVSYVFLLNIVGVIIATCLVLFLYGPMSHVLYKWFSNIRIAKPKKEKKNKARQVRVKKSAEPEEAIFIGIND